MKISVSLNNQTVEVLSEIPLSRFLLESGFDKNKSMFAVAINSEFVPREKYHTIRLSEDDLVDVVQPISGG